MPAAISDIIVPLSPIDHAICDAVSKLDLAVDREATVSRAEMNLVTKGLWRAMELDRQRRAELLLQAGPGRPRDDFSAFRRRLQIMSELGSGLLVSAGVLEPGDAAGFEAMTARPFAFLLELHPSRFEALFFLIQDRERTGA